MRSCHAERHETLLQRNNLRTDAVSQYVHCILERCPGSSATSTPQPSLNVSPSSLSRSLNDVVWFDQFFLDGLRVLHAMDELTRYSAGLVCDDTSKATCIKAFESAWMSCFWPPAAIQGDQAFKNEVLTTFPRDHAIEIRLTRPRRHSENVIESKHGIIRSVYLPLCAFASTLLSTRAAQKAISVSNDLYGSSLLSTFELANGYSRHLT